MASGVHDIFYYRCTGVWEWISHWHGVWLSQCSDYVTGWMPGELSFDFHWGQRFFCYCILLGLSPPSLLSTSTMDSFFKGKVAGSCS
jgi:hypothetical protein